MKRTKTKKSDSDKKSTRPIISKRDALIDKLLLKVTQIKALRSGFQQDCSDDCESCGERCCD